MTNRTNKSKKRENVVVVGGGPAGLSAAIYLARAGLNPIVFAGSPPGGQLTLTAEVENYPGFKSILGPELILKMRSQAVKLGAKVVDENVTMIELKTKPFSLSTGPVGGSFPASAPGVRAVGNPLSSATRYYSSRSIIIATGARALWLGVPGEERLRGKGVSACATCDGFFFKNKVVAVVGGGDTALEEALTLTKFASKVYLIHRRDSFRASKIMQERVLKHPKIDVIWNSMVSEIFGTLHVAGIKLNISSIGGSRGRVPDTAQLASSGGRETTDGIYRTVNLNLDGVFVAIGHKPDTDLFAGRVELDDKDYIITSQRLGIELTKIKDQKSKIKNKAQKAKITKNFGHYNFDYQTMTSVGGVFAAGDCADPVYRQAATSVGSGVAAALEAERWLESVETG